MCQAWARTHLTMSDLPMAPDWRVISRPDLNNANVGMLRMLNWLARVGSASVLTFTRRALGSSSAAASENCGAIMRQGPHQGAQKSTTTGTSLRSMCLWKLARVNSITWLVNRG